MRCQGNRCLSSSQSPQQTPAPPVFGTDERLDMPGIHMDRENTVSVTTAAAPLRQTGKAAPGTTRWTLLAIVSLACCLMAGTVLARTSDQDLTKDAGATTTEPTAPGSATAGGTSVTATDSSALRGYWKFNKNLADSSPWGNHATMSYARYTTGRSGQALKLDGRSWPQVPDDPSLELSNGFSVDLWVKLSCYGQTATLVGSGSMTSGKFNWGLGLQGGYLQVTYRGLDGKVSNLTVSESALPLNTWLHISAWLSVSESELGLVVHDDALLSSQMVTSLQVPSLQMQALPLLMGENFKGLLDEVKLTAL